MSDEPMPDPSPMGRSEPGSDAAAEDEVDALLEAASALANDVTEEIGVSEGDPATSQAAGSASHGPGSAPDLDTQLAQLDSLLEETNRELGTESAPPADGAMPADESKRQIKPEAQSAPQQAPPSPPSPHAEEPPADIDAQLAALDELLDVTDGEGDAEAAEAGQDAVPDFMKEFTAEDGDATAESEATEQLPATEEPAAVPDFMAEFTQAEEEADPPTPETDAPAPPTVDADVPDFMAEFTSPESGTGGGGSAPEGATGELTSSAPAVGGHTPPATSKPGVVSSRDRGVISSQDMALVGEPADGAADSMGVPDETSPARASTTSAQTYLLRIGVRLTAPLAPLAFKACEVGLGVLEACDRPVRRLGYWPRLIIGWLAIATLGASLIVYMASLF